MCCVIYFTSLSLCNNISAYRRTIQGWRIKVNKTIVTMVILYDIHEKWPYHSFSFFSPLSFSLSLGWCSFTWRFGFVEEFWLLGSLSYYNRIKFNLPSKLSYMGYIRMGLHRLLFCSNSSSTRRKKRMRRKRFSSSFHLVHISWAHSIYSKIV